MSGNFNSGEAMIELCDWDKLESEEYKKINKELKETMDQMGTILKQAITPGDHYNFDYAFIISRIKTFKNLWFLDLGSGLSPLSVYIALRGGNVITVDLNDYAASYSKLGRELEIPLTSLRADFRFNLLPSADVVVSCSAIEHDRPDSISELVTNVSKCLSPGGQFIFTVVAEPVPRVHEYQHFPYNEQKIRELFLKEGFELEEDSSNFGDWDNLYAKFRQIFPHYFYIPLGVSLIKKD